MRTRVRIGTSGLLPLVMIIGMIGIIGCGGDRADGMKLSGSAEDLWGARIDLDTCGDVTVIAPYTAST